MRTGLAKKLATAALAIGLGIAGQGATIYVSPTGNDSASGASWSTAVRTVQRAINLASGPTQIWVKAGVYTERLYSEKSDISIYGGFAGTESSVAARAGGPTILDGASQLRPLELFYANNWLLDRLTIQRGYINSFGGGIVAQNSANFQINDCAIQDCTAAGGNEGGGIYAIGGGLTMTNSTVQRCLSGSTGGGIRTLSVTVAFTNVTMADNTAARGGGLGLQGGSGFMTKCSLLRNTATSTAMEGGGGAFIRGSALQITRNFVSGNTANYGSAFDVTNNMNGYFYNNVINKNVAGTATVYVRDIGTYPYFMNNTLSDNSATVGVNGYRLANGAWGYFRNEIVAYSMGPQACVARDANCSYSWAFSTFYFNSGAPFADPNDLVAAGGTVIQTDPQFLNRALLDDPWSYQLQPNSPSIDYGYANLTYDFGLGNRPINTTNKPAPYPDRGAFEYQGVPQYARLTNWEGPNGGGDQSGVPLHVVVKNAAGAVVCDTNVPQGKDGFYRIGDDDVVSGQYFSILISANGYLKKRINVQQLPAQGSPGVSVDLIPGDANGDNIVDLMDLNMVLTGYGNRGSDPADLTGDGVVGLTDLNNVILYFLSVGDQ